MTLDTLVVPTDGSKQAEAAASRAFAFAKQLGATVHVLSVADSSVATSATYVGDSPRIRERLRNDAETYVSRLEAKAESFGLTVESTVREGIPAKEIVEYAENAGADGIFMGTAGRGRIARSIVGSVADKVVRTATVPVVTVNQTALEVGDGTSVDSILIPTDGSDPSQTAALLGADLAVQLNADVHCLSVVDEDLSDGLESALKNGDDFLSSLAEENVDRTLEGLQECPRDCVGATATGDPAEEIIDYAEEEDIDLIVMGTHGRGGFDRLVIGSVTDSVIRGAPVPVLAERVTEEDLSENTTKGK